MGGKPRPSDLLPGVWPVAIHDGKSPRTSDGFQWPGPGAKRNERGHLGVDIMFRRPAKGPEERPDKTKWFECPTGVVLALTCASGTVVRVLDSKSQGGAVYVLHGRHMSVYRHLARVDVKKGDDVAMGAVLGVVGHAPKAGKRGINHLHFELWDMRKPGPRWARSRKSIDPAPWLRRWGQRAVTACTHCPAHCP